MSSMNAISAPSIITTASVVVSVIFPVLSFIAIVLRYKARHVGQLRFQADDWWIAITWLITLSLSITEWIYASLAGVDHLKGDMESSLIRSTQGVWILSLELQVCLATVKISVLYFYKRVFSSAKRFHLAANFGIILLFVYGIIFFFLMLFENNPISGSWTGKGRPSVDPISMNLAAAGTSIGLDIIVLCFPLPVISSLHMQFRKKMFVMMIFWLGAFCCVAAIARLALLVKSTAAAAQRTGNGFTAISDDAKAIIFVTIEPNCSIIAACLPSYGPLLRDSKASDSIMRVKNYVSFSSGKTASAGSGSRKSQGKLHNNAGSEIHLRDGSPQWLGNKTQALAANTSDETPYRGNDSIEVTRTIEIGTAV